MFLCLLFFVYFDLDCWNFFWVIWLRYLVGIFKFVFNGESGIWDLGMVLIEFVLRIWNLKSWSECWVIKGIIYCVVFVFYWF